MGKEIELQYPLGICEAYTSENYSKYNHTDNNILDFAFACCSRRGIYQETDEKLEIVDGNFDGGNFFLSRWGIKIEMCTNTFFCWPEDEEHGTTVIPSHGYQISWSQNLAKRTVTAVKKWRQNMESQQHIEYRANLLNQDPLAKIALEKSIENNKKKIMQEIIESKEDIEENSDEEFIQTEVKEYMQLRYNKRKWI